jgi:carboxylate-amine ligase
VHGAGDRVRLLHVDAVPRIFTAGEWDGSRPGSCSARARSRRSSPTPTARARRSAPASCPRTCSTGARGRRTTSRASGARAVRRHRRPDIVRTPAGELVVLEDNVRTPTLMAFALLAERVTRSLVPTEPAAAPFASSLRDLLHALVGQEASVAILARDAGNVAAWEIEELGRLTGWPVVGLEDLEPRGDALVLRDTGRPVDVLWRRTSEERLRRDDGRLNALGEALLGPLAAGTVQVINAFGTGVADDKRTFPYVEDLVRFYCGEEPLLRSIPSWDLGDPAQRADVLERLDELVLKARTGSGGYAVVLGPHASAAQLRGVREAIDADPAGWIAQELVPFSTHPTVVDGRLEPRHVDLRPFVIGGRVLRGGLSRFARGAGDLVVNLSQGGGGKDVRVLAP